MKKQVCENSILIIIRVKISKGWKEDVSKPVEILEAKNSFIFRKELMKFLKAIEDS